MRMLLKLSKAPIRKYASKKKMVFFEPPHMNELPVPCAPWDVWYNNKQKKFMAIFLFGLLWSVGTGVYMVGSGCFYLNAFPPAEPAPPVFLPEEEDNTLPNVGLPPC